MTLESSPSFAALVQGPVENSNMTTTTVSQPLEPLAYTVADASRVAGIGQTKIFELLGSGRLAGSRVGRRRLIHADSLRQLIAEGC
jgi:excisionase family DNA binding protein